MFHKIRIAKHVYRLFLSVTLNEACLGMDRAMCEYLQTSWSKLPLFQKGRTRDTPCFLPAASKKLFSALWGLGCACFEFALTTMWPTEPRFRRVAKKAAWRTLSQRQGSWRNSTLWALVYFWHFPIGLRRSNACQLELNVAKDQLPVFLFGVQNYLFWQAQACLTVCGGLGRWGGLLGLQSMDL